MATSSTNLSASVVAYFTTEHQAAEAIAALQSAGFPAHQIGAARSAGYAGSNDTSYAGSSAGTSSTAGSATMPSAGTGTTGLGAKTEGVWDKVRNFFEGNDGAPEQYADEGANGNTSREITRGDFASQGAASEGYPYDRGDVSHMLTGLSVPSDRSRYFEHRLSTASGSVLVTVSAADRAEEAERILTQHGGDLGAASTSYDYNTAPAASTTASSAIAGNLPETAQQRIQLLGEVLRVHKDRISRGEVTIRKEVITEQQTIQVPVTREELVIERVPAAAQTGVQGAIGENSEIRIPLSEEQASLDKQTVVREEIAVGKRAVEDVQEVGGSVRHEELDVNDGTVGTSTVNKGGTVNR